MSVPVPPQTSVRFLGGSLADWLILLPLLVLAATHTEISYTPTGSGFTLAIRTAATCALLLLLLLRPESRLPTGHFYVSVAICGYFVFVNSGNPSFFAVMGALSIFAGLAISSLALTSARATVLLLTRYYIAFNLLGLVWAGALLITTGNMVDLHQVAFPWSTARVGEMLNVIRLTGFQIEPGNYANAIYLFVLISGLLRKRLFGWLETLSMASTVLTFSAWAAVGVVVYIAAVALEFVSSPSATSRFGRWTIALLACLVLVTSAPFLVTGYSDNEYVRYFISRFGGDVGQGSLFLKSQAFEAWKATPWLDMIFGRPMPDSFCASCVSPQDLGTLLNLTYYFGVVFSAIFITAFALRLWHAYGISFVVAALPLIVTKFYYYDPFVWLALGLGMFSAKRTQGPTGAGDVVP